MDFQKLNKNIQAAHNGPDTRTETLRASRLVMARKQNYTPRTSPGWWRIPPHTVFQKVLIKLAILFIKTTVKASKLTN